MTADLRLAGFAFGCWMAALAALYLPFRVGLILGGVALCAAVVAVLARVARWRLWRDGGGAG